MLMELDAAAPPDAMLAAFVFVLLVAALNVAATGSGLVRLPWLDPPCVCLARMPSRWDLLCFQLVLGVVVVVGAAMLCRDAGYDDRSAPGALPLLTPHRRDF